MTTVSNELISEGRAVGKTTAEGERRTGGSEGRGRRNRAASGRRARWIACRVRRCREAAEAGMSTAEYAVGTIAACGFAAVLYKIVTSGPVRTALTSLIEKALHAPF